jgi:3-dehydroquinate synthase
MTQTLTVQLGDRSYPIVVGAGPLRDTTLLRRHIVGRKLLLVSNVTVAPLYADRLRQAFADRELVEVILPDGEQHKSLAMAARVIDALVANRMGRDAQVLALGGGVVGDLAGFVAACYQRGIDFVQIPTTLLADVDSSVGGKTAVNHPGGKNLIGAFHQPRAVIADTELLQTLPERELQAGLAEVIKYGLICDAQFLRWLEDNISALSARDGNALAHAIYRSCQIKSDFVVRDERETGDRALLNLGHTFGHAIEAATDYVQWLHGEAVGVGMLVAADMSRRLGLLQAADVQRVAELLRRAGLRTAAPQIGAARALDYMGIDKKVQAGRVRLILLRKLGEAFLTGEYDDAVLRDTLAAHFG